MTDSRGAVSGPGAPRAVLSLGSNLGERLDTLQGAIDALADTPGLRIVAVSPVYETRPVTVDEASPDQPDYLNAVLVVATRLAARDLLDRAGAVENALGRERHERWGARTLDIDLVTVEGERSDDPGLVLPHPRAHERAFVLVPWHDVDPEAQLPGHGRVSDLVRKLGGGALAGVARRDDVELVVPQ